MYRMTFVAFLMFGFSIFQSADKVSDTTVSHVSEIPGYTKGLNESLGGYVFYVTPDGRHGLVITTEDLGTSNWYEAKDLVSNPTAHNKIGQQFTDWRLPTKQELLLVYDSKDEVGNLNGRGYWSSIEERNDSAWQMGFALSKNPFSFRKELDYISVRAVRSF